MTQLTQQKRSGKAART